jgi:5-methylcytosine-specific restriction endonuclease McrA
MQFIEDPKFHEPRDCFLAPIPEIFAAANLIARAVDAILEKNLTLAEDLIRQADMPELEAHNGKIATCRSKEVHRVRLVPEAPPTIKDRTQRMPSYKVELSIYERDGWHCRFCQIPVTSKEARKKLHMLLPNAARWGKTNSEKHRGLSILESTLDHLLPHSRGGDNSLGNLVTACGPCQFGRGNFTLEEVGLMNPLLRPPIHDNWEALRKLLKECSA